MPARNLSFGHEARLKISAGVDKIANAVGATLGPKGRTVMVERPFGAPMVTKDGVSVAREVEVEDKLENMGVSLVKEVALKTNDTAGDGTTTATVIAQALIKEGLDALNTGINAQAVRRGIEKGVEAVVEQIKKLSTPVKGNDIKQVASISANDPEIGKTIADAMKKVGDNGVITVEEGNSFGTEVVVVEGMQFDNGFISPYMVTNPQRMEAEYRDVAVLVTDYRINASEQIVPIFEKLAASGNKKAVIIAEDVEGQALATLVLTKVKGGFQTVAIKAPSYGEKRKAILEDIAVATGATMISEGKGMKLEDAELTDLGFAKRVICTKDTTTIVEGRGDKKEVKDRVAQLQKEIELAEKQFDKDQLKERLAKLDGGVAVVKVGAASDVEMNEIKHRIEDAIAATKAAVQEGIVPGGGVTLIRAAVALKKLKLEPDEMAGVRILEAAIESPLSRIAANAGHKPELIIEKVKSAKTLSSGWNAETNEYCDMIEAGIIDPAKVTRCALQNAASIAIMVLTTECSITEVPEARKPQLQM